MPTSTLYVSIDEVKGYVPGEDQRSANDPNLTLSLNAACRAIDAYCGRSFYQKVTATDSPTARTYRPLSDGMCIVDDFWTTSGLVIKTDDDDDGTFETTWSASDYELEPADGVCDGLEGIPYWRVMAVDDRSFPRCNRRAVQVTARWGWEAVPNPVVSAALSLTSTLAKYKQVPLGTLGFQDFGGVRVPADMYRQVSGLLAPYVRVERASGWGIA